MNFVDELNEITEAVLSLLQSGSRLTLDEIVEKTGKDQKVVDIILKSMYADRKIQALYVYEIVEEN